jgi:NAD(P)-dependent dehydrogenase (short-subunit alcohol dehydrogenase family)
MQGKVVVITGATSGIGQVAAEELARRGARIVQVARDKTRGQAALDRLRQIAPTVQHGIHYADMSSLAQLKQVADAIADTESRIDVLINNAGAMFSSRQVTRDGLEMTFALNHMAYFPADSWTPRSSGGLSALPCGQHFLGRAPRCAPRLCRPANRTWVCRL